MENDKMGEKFFSYLISHEEYDKNVRDLTKENDSHIENIKKVYGLRKGEYEMYSSVVRHCFDYEKIPEKAKGNNLFAEEAVQITSIHSTEFFDRKYAPKKDAYRLAFRPVEENFLSFIIDIIDCEEEKVSIPTRAKNGAALPNEYCCPDCLRGIISKEAYTANYKEELLDWFKGRNELIDIYKGKGIDEGTFDDITYIIRTKRDNSYQFQDLEK